MGSNGGGEDDDGEGDDDNNDVAPPTLTLTGASSADASKSKKKKRKRHGKKNKTSILKQSSPPRVPLHDLFPSGSYPTGELLGYDASSETRNTAKTKEVRIDGLRRTNESAFLDNYRKAAEIHRQARHWVQQSVKPGQTLTEIAVEVEDSVRALLDNQGLEPGQSLQAGMGFPTGLSLNNVVAHYTPNPGQKDIVLQHSDVMKVDFGVHINGWIVDSAFTMAFDPEYDNLLAAVKAATNAGIKV